MIVSPIKVTDPGSIYMTNRGYCIRCCDVGCNFPQRNGPDSILYAVIECLMCREIVVEVKCYRREDKIRSERRGAEDGADLTAEGVDLHLILAGC